MPNKIRKVRTSSLHLQVVPDKQPISFQIVHYIAGRIRLRINRLKDDLFFTEALKWLLRSRPGVREVRVNPACSSVIINFDDKQFNPLEYLYSISQADLINAEIPLEDKARKRLKKTSAYKTVQDLDVLMPPSMQAGLGILAFASALAGGPALLSRALITVASIPILNRAVRIFLDEHRLGPDALDGLSCIVLAARGQFVPAGCMVLLIGLGEYIRDLAVRRFESITAHLKALSGKSAWRVDGNERTRIPIENIPAGTLLVIYTGEIVPVDGTVSAGTGVVATRTGRSQSVSRGHSVEADSVLLEGKIYINSQPEAHVESGRQAIEQRKYRRSLYRTRFQMLSLSKAYRIFAPVLAWAGAAFLLTRNPGHALTLICFDLVTGIRIAVPSVVLQSMYCAGQRGILIRNGAALERLSEIDTIVFACSGTITEGFADVTEVIPLGNNNTSDIIKYAAAAEHRYYHPAARAIWRQARKLGISVPERSGSLLIGGLGVQADVEGRSVGVGSKSFMENENTDTSAAIHPEFYVQSRGDSLAYVSIDGKLSGLIAYRDPIRENAKSVVNQLSALSVKNTIMISGDSVSATRRVAAEAGVEKFVSELGPQEKADLIRDFQLRGHTVAMVGDDLSDELALRQADLAISMRDSVDAARFESHVVLMDDNLQQLPDAVEIGRTAMNAARENVMLFSVPNVVGLLLSLFGKIGPIHGAVLNNGSVIIVTLLGFSQSTPTTRLKL